MKKDLITGFVVLMTVGLMASGCGGGGGGGNDGNGGNGLDDPADFLTLPGVESAITDVETAGSLTLTLSTGTSPPNIVGSYTVTNTDFYPEAFPPDVSDTTISGQTSANRIHVALYGESSEYTVTYLDEIIRGSGNQFTIYGDLLVEEIDGCNYEVVYIIDGTVDGAGDIEAVMVEAYTNFTPEICTFDSDAYGSDILLERL